jgi:hypothetical protein
MTTQLFCRDLRGGDILLKVNAGSLTNRVIKTAQSMVRSTNPDVVHAGILFDATIIIEASGPGLSARDLRVQDKAFGYYVYRCSNTAMANGAGTCSKMFFDIQGRTKAMKYNLLGAAGSLFGNNSRPSSRDSMDTVLDKILQGKGHPFFCSQFVVYVYQFVAEQNGITAATLFNFSDAKVNPSILATSLMTHQLFTEVGYLMPNER